MISSDGGRAGEFQLADWRVEPSLNRLHSSDRTVRLEPRLMDLLVFLSQRPGEVVSKEQLVEGVWKGAFITDTAISRAVAGLRKALGDDAREPRFIETIPKRGYRLVVSPREVASRPLSGRPPAGGSPGTSGPPFVVGQWVRGAAFYGRAEQIEEVLGGNRDGIWLLGARRSGKTSFLKQLEQLAAEEHFCPLFWDLEGAADPDDLHRDFRDALLDGAEQLASRGIELSEVEDEDLFVSLGRLRRALRERGSRLLLLCDEAEELLQLQRQDPALLRKLRRALEPRHEVRAVLAASLRLWGLAEEEEGDTSPFLHGFIPPLYLGVLRDDEARDLVCQSQLRAAHRPGFDDQTVERILDRSGNHPFLIQILCRRVLETGDVGRACEEVAADEMMSHFFAVDFRTLSEVEREILRLLADRGPSTTEAVSELGGRVAGSLHRLHRLGFLRRVREEEWAVGNDFFRRWLAQGDPSG